MQYVVYYKVLPGATKNTPKSVMKKWIILFLLVACAAITNGGAPFFPREGSVPFIVYYLSRYRGICVGTLVSRTAVLTAAVCVTHPTTVTKDTRPINVVAATGYRHPRRGIRVPVAKIIIPKWSNVTSNRGYLMQRSPALMILSRIVPDVMAEVPMRGIAVDFESGLFALHEECATFGWHFFQKGKQSRHVAVVEPLQLTVIYIINSSIENGLSRMITNAFYVHQLKKDVIYAKRKFLLNKNLRVQFMNIAKKHIWCDPLSISYHAALNSLGFTGYSDANAFICIRDPDRLAQPCHGMYGAPIICRGKAVAMLMAPDAQWTNCTGFSNLVHVFKNSFLTEYMHCIKGLFNPEFIMDWEKMKLSFSDNINYDYDYIPEMYDSLTGKSGSTEEK